MILRGSEDTSSQAGWMFADLFLALTVIFLATVSFIPSGQNPDKVNSNNSNSNSQNNTNVMRDNQLVLISNGFIGLYKSGNLRQFKSDLSSYVKSKNLSNDTSALFLEVIGHTENFGQPNDPGNLEALKFVINLRNSLPLVFQGTNTSINLSPDVDLGQVRVRVTFI